QNSSFSCMIKKRILKITEVCYVKQGSGTAFAACAEAGKIYGRRAQQRRKRRKQGETALCVLLSRQLRNRYVPFGYENFIQPCQRARRRVVRTRVCPVGGYGRRNAQKSCAALCFRKRRRAGQVRFNRLYTAI